MTTFLGEVSDKNVQKLIENNLKVLIASDSLSQTLSDNSINCFTGLFNTQDSLSQTLSEGLNNNLGGLFAAQDSLSQVLSDSSINSFTELFTTQDGLSQTLSESLNNNLGGLFAAQDSLSQTLSDGLNGNLSGLFTNQYGLMSSMGTNITKGQDEDEKLWREELTTLDDIVDLTERAKDGSYSNLLTLMIFLMKPFNLFSAQLHGIEKSLEEIKSTTEKLKDIVNGDSSSIFDGVDVASDLFGLPGAWIALLGNLFSFKAKGPSFLATGGFPAMGQMFIAREAGPELVGSLNGRTAVVNNDQIVQSVAGGVYDANREQNAILHQILRAVLEKDTGVYLDGKELYINHMKQAQSHGMTLGLNPAFAR